MNRRDMFRALLGGVAAAATFDIERLLWLPGEKTIFIPPAFQTVFAVASHPIRGVAVLYVRTAGNPEYIRIPFAKICARADGLTLPAGCTVEISAIS
jgi:hypothetical protein